MSAVDGPKFRALQPFYRECLRHIRSGFLTLLCLLLTASWAGCAAGRSSGLTEQPLEPPHRETSDTLRAQAAVDELVRDLTPEQQAALIKALGKA